MLSAGALVSPESCLSAAVRGCKDKNSFSFFFFTRPRAAWQRIACWDMPMLHHQRALSGTRCVQAPAPPRCDSLSPRRGPICETPARDRCRHRRLLRGSVQTHLLVSAQMMDGQIGGSGSERRRDGPVMITSQLCSVSLPSSTR